LVTGFIMADTSTSTSTASVPLDQAIHETFQQAVAHHQAGQLQEAEKLYRAILQISPNHPDANHNMGVLAVQAKQPTDGLPYLMTALEADPTSGQYWLSYIDALFQAEQPEAARQLLAHAQRQGLQGEAVDKLALLLGVNGQAENRSGADHQHDDPPPTLAAARQNNKKQRKFAEPAKVVKKTVPSERAGEESGLQDINMLVALFNNGRYAEMETIARKVTERFPNGGIGWKALGAAVLQQGRYAEALPPLQKAAALLHGDAEAHNNLGNTLLNLGRLSEAEASYRRALEISPDYVEVYSKLGNTLKNQGRLAEAEASYQRALEIKPDYAEAYYNLGVTFQEQDRLNEAAASYRHALEIRPGYAEVHSNLGVILLKLGQTFEAESSLRRALEIKPDYAEAYSNLGTALWEQGRFPEAEDNYRRALVLKPDFPEGLNNLALILNARDEPITALNLVVQSLQLRETMEAKGIFVACVKRLRFSDSTITIRDFLVRALSEPWGKPSDLARTGADLVKSNRDVGECVSRAAEAWPQRLPMQQLLGSNGIGPVASDPLLCALLNSAPICDIDLERFLTMMRHGLLDVATRAIASVSGDKTILSFCSSLAQQCFINEYVFVLTDHEADQAYTLRNSLAAALEAKSPIPALWPVAVAAYFPLQSLPLASHLLDRVWPDAVSAVLVQQICEPAEEEKYRPLIPRLTAIENEVSLEVQSQYEGNPYPRWVRTGPANKLMTVDGFLRKSFPSITCRPFGKSNNPDILIAGCGTGLHPIGVAQRFRKARILAVDLSLTSLCYAKRKTQELGLDMIEYAQADILKMGTLGRSFDIIESVGVLHHLHDPMAGWLVLLSLLRPGGIMKLGFYSEVARRDIVRARSFIAEQGYGSTSGDIRRCRQDLMNFSESTGFGFAIRSEDFFSISACRDLLFHVQEHRMTLADISAFISANNLQFLGFEIDAHILHAFRLRFPDDRAMTNLVYWQTFEEDNPDTFLGMYQFWIQKTDLPLTPSAL
jgi:tetratricopeptide (TPR) repeat protein/SAM-dependent methyltransferase